MAEAYSITIDFPDRGFRGYLHALGRRLGIRSCYESTTPSDPGTEEVCRPFVEAFEKAPRKSRRAVLDFLKDNFCRVKGIDYEEILLPEGLLEQSS